ncbi:MAG TPA: ribosomal protein S18-alanine N-acetyltransferase [Sphingomonadales bacterium]
MMSGHGELRRIGPEGGELLAEIRRAASQSLPWRPEDFAGLLSQPTVRCFLLIDQDADGVEGPVGYSLYACTGDEGEIYDLAVLPDFRRSGRGKMLLLAAIIAARAQGARRIHLEVDEHNEAARKLYEALGFEVVGRRKNYYRDINGKVSDALVMRLTLK